MAIQTLLLVLFVQFPFVDLVSHPGTAAKHKLQNMACGAMCALFVENCGSGKNIRNGKKNIWNILHFDFPWSSILNDDWCLLVWRMFTRYSPCNLLKHCRSIQLKCILCLIKLSFSPSLLRISFRRLVRTVAELTFDCWKIKHENENELFSFIITSHSFRSIIMICLRKLGGMIANALS